MPNINQAAVLDVGSQKISVIIGEQGINGILKIKARGECEYDGFSDGEFFDKKLLEKAIFTALENAENTVKNPINKIYVTVPGEFCSSVISDSSISFKSHRKVTEIDINELLRAEKATVEDNYELIGSYPVYYTLDETRKLLNPAGLPAASLSARISYIYAETSFTQLLRSILAKINLDCEFLSSAAGVCGILFSTQDKLCMVADVGYLTTSVMLCQGAGIMYMKSFSAGGAYVSADLMECLHIPFADAEKLKDNLPINLEPDENEKLIVAGKDVNLATAVEIISARIESLGELIKKCMDDCPHQYPENMSLYLTGGGISYIRGAKDVLSRTIYRNVEIATVDMPKAQKPHLTSSYGALKLALAGEEHAGKGFWKRLLGR